MGYPHKLPAEADEVALLEREAQNQAVAAIRLPDRKAKRENVELSGQMFDRTVVGLDRPDPQRRLPRPDAEPRHDLLRSAKPGGSHGGSLRTAGDAPDRLALPGTPCAVSNGMVGHRIARPVLVVDDDDAVRSAEHAVLADNGFRVIEARDGAEAMWLVQHDPPAVVVLDVQMPGVDGPSFARSLRLALRHVPLVILTAARDPWREADRCNAEAYLAKPFDAGQLVQVVRRFAM